MSVPSQQANTPKAKSFFGVYMLLLTLLVALAGTAYWRYFKPHSSNTHIDTSPEALDQRLLSVEQSLVRIERERSNLQQRISDSSNRTNLLRDEVLGVTERAGLIEDSIRELGRSERSAQDSLRLNEAELLLTIASERWQLSGDLPGTLQATELASQAINALKDPQWVNLRQAIAQELLAFRTLGPDPRLTAKGELDALEAALPQFAPSTGQASQAQNSEHGATRLLNALIRIQPTGQQTLITPSDRHAAKTALELEIASARMALHLRNSADFKASVVRINQWLVRLYANTPQLKDRRAKLVAIANTPLSMPMLLAGSSLAELQRLKQGAKP
jgi:uroporphyrin-III C-methyltransferase